MKNKNSAFTLVEVLVAVVIGVISILAAFSSYNYFNKSYKSVSQKSAINSSAREALTVIARDLRNAGYIDINYTRVSKPEIQLINLWTIPCGIVLKRHGVAYAGCSPGD